MLAPSNYLENTKLWVLFCLTLQLCFRGFVSDCKALESRRLMKLVDEIFQIIRGTQEGVAAVVPRKSA